MNKEEFQREMEKLGIKLSKKQMTLLDEFYHQLIKWNQVMNLTRITEEEEVYLKHYYDSLTLVKIANLEKAETLCDIGSGAGFPGIVLKIVFPNLKITLIDSLKKRVDYLNSLIEYLHLEDIKAIHTRAEDYAKENRETFDIVTARAVAPLKTLLNYAIPMVKVNGSFLAMKGNVEEEINDARLILKELNCEIEKKVEFLLPQENSHRTLLKITKKEKTKLAYPRKISGSKKNIALK